MGYTSVRLYLLAGEDGGAVFDTRLDLADTVVQVFGPVADRLLHQIRKLLRRLQKRTVRTYKFWNVSSPGVKIRGDVKIPHRRMTKTCWETLVTCL